MKNLKFCVLTLIAAFALVGCSEDELVSGVQEGLPAQVKFEFEVPQAQEIAVTRAINEFEYSVKDVTLVMFNKSGYKQVLTLGASDLTLEEANASGMGNAKYSCSKTFNVLSGNYDVYVIANYNNSNCAVNVNLNTITTKAQMESAMAQLTNNSVAVTGSKLLPMTDYQQCEIAPATEESVNTVSGFSLRRNTAKIEFTFANGSHVSGGKTIEASFIPHTYQVYNVPKKAYLIDKRDNGVDAKSGRGVISIANKLDGNTYFNTEEIAISGDGSFSFFMLENVQEAKNACTTYADRDKWSGTTTPKAFENAPDNGTYVVVKGTYVDEEYSGEVSYTIHLGNFSDATKTETNYNNFKVNRNEYQKYKVTVKGVSSIVAEVETDEEDGGVNPGAEGNLAKAKNNFVLDAHYETVMLAIPSEKWGKLTSSSVTEHKVRVISPATDFEPVDYTWTKAEGATTYTAPTSGDFGWIQFEKPSSKDAFPTFNAGHADYDTYRTNHNITAFFNDPSAFALSVTEDGVTTYYVTAFVDEYFYSSITDMKKWVNTKNRTFMCDFESVNPSKDTQSSLIEDFLFSLNQRSIKTVYDVSYAGTDASFNPFGIETWDETPAMAWNWNSTNKATITGTTRRDGWTNTKLHMDKTNLASSYNFAKNGYLTPVETNDKASHVYSEKASDIISACISRNRDKNGDGVISSDELEWYLPALDQYLITWMGTNELNEDTRLFETDAFAGVKLVSNKPYYSDGTTPVHHMVTSSAITNSSDAIERVWWQEQCVTYGRINVDWEDNNYDFRAARTLKGTSTICSLPFELLTYKDSMTVVVVKTVSSKRQNDMSGQLPQHVMTDDENKLPPVAFELGKVSNVGNVTATSLTARDIAPLNTAALEYTQETGKGDLGTWRVANQRELMLVSMIGEDYKPTNGYYFCCTLHPSTDYKLPFCWYIADDGVNLTLDNSATTTSAAKYIPVRDINDAALQAEARKVKGFRAYNYTKQGKK